MSDRKYNTDDQKRFHLLGDVRKYGPAGGILMGQLRFWENINQQRQSSRYIVKVDGEDAIPKSVQAMSNETGLTPGEVRWHYDRLEKKGAIRTVVRYFRGSYTTCVIILDHENTTPSEEQAIDAISTTSPPPLVVHDEYPEDPKLHSLPTTSESTHHSLSTTSGKGAHSLCTANVMRTVSNEDSRRMKTPLNPHEVGTSFFSHSEEDKEATNCGKEVLVDVSARANSRSSRTGDERDQEGEHEGPFTTLLRQFGFFEALERGKRRPGQSARSWDRPTAAGGEPAAARGGPAADQSTPLPRGGAASSPPREERQGVEGKAKTLGEGEGFSSQPEDL